MKRLALLAASLLALPTLAHGQWTQLASPEITSLVSYQNVLVGVNSRSQPISSTDRGATWKTTLNPELFAPTVLPDAVVAMKSLPFDHTNIIYRSTDGMTWSAVGSSPSTITGGYLQLLKRTDDGNYWAVNVSAQLFRTGDGGQTWTDVTDNLKDKNIRPLTTLGNTIFCNATDGVYRRTATEATWTKVDYFPGYIADMVTSGDVLIAYYYQLARVGGRSCGTPSIAPSMVG